MRPILLSGLDDIRPSDEVIFSKRFASGSPTPENWQIQLNTNEDVEASGYPSPWAWALMTTEVLRQRKWDLELFVRYKTLLQAVALGYLELEIFDLESLAFGQVLLRADDRFRYLGLIRTGATLQNAKQRFQGAIWGATCPEALVFPAPRRTREEWQDLFDLVQGKEKDALQPWADLRSLLRDNKQWAPEHVPWMAALDQILDASWMTSSEGCQTYHAHSRTVGPVSVKFADGSLQPLYLPVFARDFARSFLRGLTGRFEKEKGQAGDVVIRDSRGQEAYRIAIPQLKAGGDFRLAGGGVVRPREGMVQPYFDNPRIRLRDDANGPGYFTVLREVYDSFPEKGNELAEQVQREPYRYPDSVRIVIQRLGEAGVGNATIIFSDRALQVLFEQNLASLPRLQELDQSADKGSWKVYNGGSNQFVFLEKYKGIDFGDLRALGWALWQFFNCQAYCERGEIRDAERGESLTDGIFASPKAYVAVGNEDGKEQYRRLATLQRFVKAYQDEDSEEASLCRMAVEAFAQWVWNEAVLPNGPHRRRKHDVQVGGVRFSLARDDS